MGVNKFRAIKRKYAAPAIHAGMMSIARLLINNVVLVKKVS